jgi:putative DNA methylase
MEERDDAASPLVDYLRALKTATTDEAAELKQSAPPLIWHPGSFDYWVRSGAELDAIVEYVADNPISAGHVRSREQWFFCSAHDRFLHDGETSGWLPSAPCTRG